MKWTIRGTKDHVVGDVRTGGRGGGRSVINWPSESVQCLELDAGGCSQHQQEEQEGVGGGGGDQLGAWDAVNSQ